MAAEKILTTDEKITGFFTEWTAERLTSNLSEQMLNLFDFAEQLLKICLLEISHHNPAHLLNKAMNACLSKYSEWGIFLSAGNRGIIWKLIHNSEILHHQCKRYKWYEETDEDDETKNFINAIVEADENGQSFIEFLQSMYKLYFNILYIIFLNQTYLTPFKTFAKQNIMANI